jgi:transposase
MSRTDLQGCICPHCVVDDDVRATHGRWIEMMSLFNERQARLYAAEKAMALGHGGITLVSEVLGLSERTIRRGIEELESGGLGEMPERARRPGAGRKASEEVDSSLVDDLELLMGETTAGDPMRLLKWTTKSLRSIATELTQRGHTVSHPTVHRLLRELDYSLWGNKRSIEGQQATSATGCSISLPVPAGETLYACKNPRNFRGYQEEGTGGGVPQQGASLGKKAACGQRLRLSVPG